MIKLGIDCMHCLESGSKEIYPVINGNKDFEAKQLILDEMLFVYRCPYCGNYQEIRYDCMYVDDELKYIVVLDREKVINEFSDYQVRIVRDLKELKEKIVIWENGLDDRIIEIMKHQISRTLKSKATYRLILSNDNGLGFILVYPDGEIIKTFDFNIVDYQSLKDKYIGVLENKKIVDNKYATKVVGSYL